LTINEEQLKFVKSPQMKFDKDPFLVKMNMVELDGQIWKVWKNQTIQFGKPEYLVLVVSEQIKKKLSLKV
jgi:hypothetical protein